MKKMIALVLCLYFVLHMQTSTVGGELIDAVEIGSLCPQDDLSNCNNLSIERCSELFSTDEATGQIFLNRDFCPNRCALVRHSNEKCEDGVSYKLAKCLRPNDIPNIDRSRATGVWRDTGLCEEVICNIVSLRNYTMAVDQLLNQVFDNDLLTDETTCEYRARVGVIAARICPGEVVKTSVMYLLACKWKLRSKRMYTGDNPCSWPGVTCDNLEVVEIIWYNSNLRGTIPTEIGHLSHLHRLSLDQNYLSGSIPYGFRNLTDLMVLDLDYNQLTGTLPEFLFDFTSLTWLDLDNNNFIGTLSFSVSNLQHITAISLFNNQFTGHVPESLSQPEYLEHVYLDGNLFGGFCGEALCDKVNTGKMKELTLNCNNVNCPCATHCL
mmetsp:Transcript_18709/g.42714  ORF Transcript_18709/g.42714 Transcript_18709/m.42714 type:complete len:381 (-) Transcript_18709:209-1351(-)